MKNKKQKTEIITFPLYTIYVNFHNNIIIPDIIIFKEKKYSIIYFSITECKKQIKKIQKLSKLNEIKTTSFKIIDINNKKEFEDFSNEVNKLNIIGISYFDEKGYNNIKFKNINHC